MQRVLALETSSRRGSVALYAGELVAQASHEIPNAHGEQLGKLVDRCLAEAGWSKYQLDRLAVGIGPGSFTGLRVGIALAQGMALGLERPLLGVSSLAALARGQILAVSSLNSHSLQPVAQDNAPRAALLDARRDEIFAQLFAAADAALSEPLALKREHVAAQLRELAQTEPIWIGEVALELGLTPSHAHGFELPSALCVAELAADATPEDFEPLYVRAADAIKPNLPRSFVAL